MADNEPVLRPEPVWTLDSAFFWEGAKQGELLIKRCDSCKKLWHPPRPMCPDCHAIAMVPVKMSGRATVYSWAMPIHPFPHGFATPPVVALVDLEEGVRLVTNLRGVDPRAPLNGMKVQVAFEPTQNGGAVPVFEPVAEG